MRRSLKSLQVMLGMVLVIGPQHVLACATSEPSCLRELYSRPPAQWPAPQVDAGVAWQEPVSYTHLTLPTICSV